MENTFTIKPLNVKPAKRIEPFLFRARLAKEQRSQMENTFTIKPLNVKPAKRIEPFLFRAKFEKEQRQ
jgi:hypothetical protein